jgi:hypothetical protein
MSTPGENCSFVAKFISYEFSPIVLLALGGLMLSLGALAGPETKHVDFNR